MIKKRENYSPKDIKFLNDIFLINNIPSVKERKYIAEELQKSEISIKYWFRNKRYKLKKSIKVNSSYFISYSEILKLLASI